MVSQPDKNIIEISDSEYRTTPLNPRDLALYLGYNLESKLDLDRLSKNVDWVNETREQQEKRSALRPPIIIGVCLAILSGIITIGVTWFIHTSGL